LRIVAHSNCFVIARFIQWDSDKLGGFMFSNGEEDDQDSMGSLETHEVVIDPTKRDVLTGSLTYSEKLKLMQLLDAWEEPVRHDDPSNVSFSSRLITV